MIAEATLVVVEQVGWSFDLASYFIGVAIGLIVAWLNLR